MDKDLEREIEALTAAIDAGDTSAETLYRRGRLYWRAGDKRRAITDYEGAVAADPESPARLALESAREVMAFYHRDLYNP